jgi:hypothetical protein
MVHESSRMVHGKLSCGDLSWVIRMMVGMMHLE